jgi:hypothetical protein
MCEIKGAREAEVRPTFNLATCYSWQIFQLVHQEDGAKLLFVLLIV